MILSPKEREKIDDLFHDMQERLGNPINMDEKDNLGMGGVLWFIHKETPPSYKGLCGFYTYKPGFPVINIFTEEMDSLEEIVFTCIHEYIHHLQPNSEEALQIMNPDGTIEYPHGKFKVDCLEYDADTTAAMLFPEFWIRHFT